MLAAAGNTTADKSPVHIQAAGYTVPPSPVVHTPPGHRIEGRIVVAGSNNRYSRPTAADMVESGSVTSIAASSGIDGGKRLACRRSTRTLRFFGLGVARRNDPSPTMRRGASATLATTSALVKCAETSFRMVTKIRSGNRFC